MGKCRAGISEHEGNMLIISYIFNVLEVVFNRGIRWRPLGDTIFPCNILKIIKNKKSGLTRKNAKPVTCGFNKQKNRGFASPA